MARRGLELAFALLLGGCVALPPGVDAGPSDAGPLSLLLGTGAHEFTPVAEHQTLMLARGCQGLQHVWIALRATGIANRGVRVRLALRRADGTSVSADFDTAITFTPDPSGAWADLWGVQLVVPLPDQALGRPLVLWGEITDREGRTTSAMRDVDVVWGTEICGS